MGVKSNSLTNPSSGGNTAALGVRMHLVLLSVPATVFALGNTPGQRHSFSRRPYWHFRSDRMLKAATKQGDYPSRTIATKPHCNSGQYTPAATFPLRTAAATPRQLHVTTCCVSCVRHRRRASESSGHPDWTSESPSLHLRLRLRRLFGSFWHRAPNGIRRVGKGRHFRLRLLLRLRLRPRSLQALSRFRV